MFRKWTDYSQKIDRKETADGQKVAENGSKWDLTGLKKEKYDETKK